MMKYSVGELHPAQAYVVTSLFAKPGFIVAMKLWGSTSYFRRMPTAPRTLGSVGVSLAALFVAFVGVPGPLQAGPTSPTALSLAGFMGLRADIGREL
jgi:hypothetical protein